MAIKTVTNEPIPQHPTVPYLIVAKVNPNLISLKVAENTFVVIQSGGASYKVGQVVKLDDVRVDANHKYYEGKITLSNE